MTSIKAYDGIDELHLKNCPFCGGEPILLYKGNHFTKKRAITIKCKKCRVQITHGAIRHSIEWLEQQIEDSWNHRTSGEQK